MKVTDAIERLKGNPVVLGDTTKEVHAYYAGDFLSFAISKQEENCMWFTVMNNVNVAGVATLTDCSLIVICDGIQPDEQLVEKAKAEKLNICTVEAPMYDAIVRYMRSFL